MLKETIIKIKKREFPYVQIDKRNLENINLSWKAKGLLTYLLSKPNDWKIYVSELIKRSTDGENSIRSGLKELEKIGHLIKRRIKDKKGRFIGLEYIVYEDLSERGKNPYVENPNVENPDVENQALLIKNTTNKDNTNKEREISPSEEMKLFLEEEEYLYKIANKFSEKTSMPKDMMIKELRKFKSYWSELNGSGKKQRWQLQQTFQLQRRLITWFKNGQEFRNNKKKKIIL